MATTPHEYLDFVDGSGHSVRDRFLAALLAELERLPLPARFDRERMARQMTHEVLEVFVNSDDHGLVVPGDPDDDTDHSIHSIPTRAGIASQET